jgi:hypothetical protein
MPRSVADVRLDEGAACRYWLVVEGETDSYTDDESGGLLGSGLGTWVGLSETAVGSGGGNEVLGTRRVRGGLIVPDEITFAIEPKSGTLQPAPVTFELLDVDDTLSYLFASEGKPYDQLAEHVAPGTSALGTSLSTYGGGTTNPRGRYIGAERIGPSGQRRFCPALPFTLIGPDHPVATHLPPVLVSDDPLEFAGRMVTLYRIYKLRPELPDSDPTAWATWDEAHAAGDLVWWGVLRDAGNVSASDRWSLDCHGPEALTRRTLGTRSSSRWMKITADLALTDDERFVSIGFMSQSFGGNQFHYQGSSFSHQLTASDGRAEMCADIDQWIEDAMDGTSVNTYAAEDLFEDWEDTTPTSFDPDAGVDSEGRFFVRRNAFLINATLQFGILCVAMHERAWLKLGWEPWRQHSSGPWEDLIKAQFKELEAGVYNFELDAVVPTSGYWLAKFNTIYPGATIWEYDYYTNAGGEPRYWHPMHTSGVFVLDQHGGQVIRLLGQDSESVYVEGQLTAGIDSESHEIDGSPVELGCWCALRGERIKVTDDPETEEIELSEKQQVHLVAFVEWIQGARYGSVSEGSGIVPAMYISRYERPRTFGWNNIHIQEPWAGKTSGKGEIEICPLRTYHYERDSKPFELSFVVWLQVMLSTGGAPGWSAPLDEGATFTNGDNQPVTAFTFVDAELADMGLGIPHQLVQSPEDVFAAFNDLPGGAAGPLNRVRHAYIGPYQAQDVLSSLMRPRRLCWSLHGKRLGVFKLGAVSPEDADITITEDDLHGAKEDPGSTRPIQSMRVTGQLDRIDLAYRFDPEAGKTVLEAQYPALDAQARARTGELVERVVDHGLCPTPWFGETQEDLTGVADWSEPFRELWAREGAEFFAKRHYYLEMSLSCPLGQDAMPGSSVCITNRWPVNPQGGRGITNATGRIIRATHKLREHCTRIGCIVFAGGPVVHYAPALLLAEVDGTTVRWYDYTGVDDDGRGLVEPEWSTTGGELQVDLFQRDGNTWSLVFSAGVVSADLSTRTAVLDAAPGAAILRDKDTWMVPRSHANQNADEWPRAQYGVQTDTDQTIGDATTKAPPFVS